MNVITVLHVSISCMLHKYSVIAMNDKLNIHINSQSIDVHTYIHRSYKFKVTTYL